MHEKLSRHKFFSKGIVWIFWNVGKLWWWACYVPNPHFISVLYYHTEFDTIITMRITYSELIAACPLEMIYDISLELSSSMLHNQSMHAMLICSDREEWPWMISECYSRQFVPVDVFISQSQQHDLGTGPHLHIKHMFQ